jgi:hypothetical protein
MSTNEFKIAVLIPTRARTAALKLSIVSLINRALKPESIQLVIGFDDDDLEGLKFFSEDTQKWLEEKNPHYIHCLPSVFKQIDTSKISNFIDHKGTGEVGGKAYSSEECGIIALTCPDNPSVYHVMENQIVEVDLDGALIITTTSNKYIKRYKHGDHIELGKCTCGRRLQTIKKIHGRVRNMMILSNGDKKWPLVGSLQYESFGIKRFQMVQTKIDELELSIICEPLNERELDLIEVVKKQIGFDINVIIKYVDDFPNYKFEEFIHWTPLNSLPSKKRVCSWQN